MIVTNLKGGIGNQMFQYALGRKLSLTNKDTFKLDTSGLERANEVGDVYRPYALDAFAITASIATSEEVRPLKHPYGPFSRLARFWQTKVLQQAHVGFEPEVLEGTGDRYLDGYWQSPKYFEDIRETLLQDFTAKEPFSPLGQTLHAQMQATESVAMHVRRGDYVSNAKVRNAYGPCSLAYYERAIQEIQERVAVSTWFVFSDDVAWTKANLVLPGDTVYVSGHSIRDAEELLLMAACKHNIIANSTFSWWGAWLNRNPGKVVIAPLPWFDTKKDQHKDLIPSTWIRVPKN